MLFKKAEANYVDFSNYTDAVSKVSSNMKHKLKYIDSHFSKLRKIVNSYYE